MATSGALLHIAARDFKVAAERWPLLLATFTTRWCARCVELTSQLQRAALLLKRMAPALETAIAVIDMSDASNQKWLIEDRGSVFERGVFSFPVGRLFHKGAMVSTYFGGPTATAIAQELYRTAEDISQLLGKYKRAAKAGAREPRLQEHAGGADAFGTSARGAARGAQPQILSRQDELLAAASGGRTTGPRSGGSAI